MKTSSPRYTRNSGDRQQDSKHEPGLPRIGITGAGGFIGLNLVESLCAKGYDVSCLVLPGETLRGASRPKTVEGNILDPSSLDDFVRDRDVIVHLAGLTRAKNERGFRRVNVEGTRNLFDAAKRSASSVRQVVVMSSQSVVGPTPVDSVHDESAAFNPLTPYARSKMAAELVAGEFSGEIPHTIIRAPAVYGPFDRDFVSLVRLAKRGYSIVMGDNPSFSHVFVKNLVHGIVLAIDNPEALNEVFFLSDSDDSTWSSFGKAFGRAFKRETRDIRIPYPIIAVVGFFGSLLQLVWPRPILLTMHKLRELKQTRWLVSIGKAIARLGYKPPFAFVDAVCETATWYEKEGLL